MINNKLDFIFNIIIVIMYEFIFWFNLGLILKLYDRSRPIPFLKYLFLDFLSYFLSSPLFLMVFLLHLNKKLLAYLQVYI